MHLLEALAAARLLTYGLGDLLRCTLLRRLLTCLATRLPRLGLLPVAVAFHEALALAALAIARPVLIAPEGPVGTLVLTVILPLVLMMTLIRVTLRPGVVLTAALRTWLRLVTRHEGLLEAVIAALAIVAELVRALARLARSTHAVAATIGPLARLVELVAIGHDDAAVMLGMLQIVLSQHRVAARLRLARQREVLLRDVGGGTANPLCRAVRFGAARQGIAVVTFAAVVIAATTAPVLLSLPH